MNVLESMNLSTSLKNPEIAWFLRYCEILVYFLFTPKRFYLVAMVFDAKCVSTLWKVFENVWKFSSSLRQRTLLRTLSKPNDNSSNFILILYLWILFSELYRNYALSRYCRTTPSTILSTYSLDIFSIFHFRCCSLNFSQKSLSQIFISWTFY